MNPKVKLKIPRSLFATIVEDLRRHHDFAFERVGFVFGQTKKFDNNNLIVFLNEYHPVHDDNYIEDRSVGARINSNAITKAMQIAFEKQKSSFHTHLHDFEFDNVVPQFSLVDKEEFPAIAKNAVSFARGEVHGIIVLTGNSINVILFLEGYSEPIVPVQISIIGYPMVFSFPQQALCNNEDAENWLQLLHELYFSWRF